MKIPVYVISNSSKLSKSGETLLITTEGKTSPVPTNTLGHIIIYGNAIITPQMFHYLGEKGIPILMFTYGGKYTGSFLPAPLNIEKYRLEQYRAYENEEKRLRIAKAIIEGSAQNKISILKKRNSDIDEWIEKIQMRLPQLREVTSVEDLRLVEAHIAKDYYRALDKSLLRLGLPSRTYNPPETEVNALLSFSYSLLYGEILAKVYECGMCPYLGMVHEMNNGHLALVYDVSEIFKPMVDNFVLNLVNKNMIREEHFLKHKDTKEGRTIDKVYINNLGKPIIMKEWLAFVRKTYDVDDRKKSLREVIRTDVLRLRESFIHGRFSGWRM